MESLNLEDLLSISSGNIVGLARHQDIIRALLCGPAGTWRTLAELDPAGRIERDCAEFSLSLAPQVAAGLRLTWTLNPDAESPEDTDFCAVLFFYGRNELLWHSVALFNRTTL